MTHRTLAALAVLVLGAAFASPALAQSAPPGAILTVTGEGSVTLPPDRATVSFRVETIDDAAAAATSHNAAIANALTAKLATLGIPAADVKTTSYGLSYNPRPPHPDPASNQRFGYTVERTIDVTVERTDATGSVVDAGVAAGVTTVNGISFALRDPRAALRSAQTVALADAVAQARSLAEAAGQRLVRIRAIAPGGSPLRAPMPAMRMTMAAAAVPTTIDPTNLTVQATVTLEYEIAPMAH